MDCSTCEKKKAAAAPELTSEQKMFLLAQESKDARYHNLIRWMLRSFIACILAIVIVFILAWTSYDYVGVDVDSGENGIANYIGDRGVIINGENSGSQEN